MKAFAISSSDTSTGAAGSGVMSTFQYLEMYGCSCGGGSSHSVSCLSTNRTTPTSTHPNVVYGRPRRGVFNKHHLDDFSKLRVDRTPPRVRIVDDRGLYLLIHARLGLG